MAIKKYILFTVYFRLFLSWIQFVNSALFCIFIKGRGFTFLLICGICCHTPRWPNNFCLQKWQSISTMSRGHTHVCEWINKILQDFINSCIPLYQPPCTGHLLRKKKKKAFPKANSWNLCSCEALATYSTLPVPHYTRRSESRNKDCKFTTKGGYVSLFCL